MTDVDLDFLAQQIERAHAELTATRADLAVLVAALGRLERSSTALLNEMRAGNERLASALD